MRTNGAALGTDTRASTANRPKPKLRNVSFATGSTSRSPYMVLMRTGHEAAKTITVIFTLWPSAISSVTKGRSATEGMGRRNSTMGRAASSARGRVPSSTPSGTAIRIAVSSPIAQTVRVPQRSVRKSASATSPPAAASTVETGGSSTGSIRPERPASSAAMRRTATPAAPRTTRRSIIEAAGPAAG